MKASKVFSIAVVVLLLAVSLFAAIPSSDAASVSATETKYIHKAMYSGTMTVKAGSTLDARNSIFLYTMDEYEKWNTDGTGVPFKTVEPGQVISDVSGTFGVTAFSSSINVTGKTEFQTVRLSVSDNVSMTFTGMKGRGTTAHIDLGTHEGTVKILVISTIGSMNVKSSGVENIYASTDYDKYIMCKAEVTDETQTTVDLSFTCANTDVYYVFVGYDSGLQAVTCSITVNGAADFTNSNAISIVLIVVAIVLLGALLYVSNKKLIK